MPGKTITVYSPDDDAPRFRARLNTLCADEGFGLRYSRTPDRGALSDALRALVAGDAVLSALPDADMREAAEVLGAMATPWAQSLARSIRQALARKETNAP